MYQNMILFPAMAMLLLNLAVAVVLLARRVKAVQQGMNPGYFRFNRGVKLPDNLLMAEQHYQNIHEMPMAFYVIVLMTYLVMEPTTLFLLLAWSYVGFRMIHSLIHLGSNNIFWRRNAFVASFLVLSLMWLVLLVEILPVNG